MGRAHARAWLLSPQSLPPPVAHNNLCWDRRGENGNPPCSSDQLNLGTFISWQPDLATPLCGPASAPTHHPDTQPRHPSACLFHGWCCCCDTVAALYRHPYRPVVVAVLRCVAVVWSLRTTPFKRRLLPIHSAAPLPLHPHSRLTGQRQGKVSCSRVVVRFVVFGQLKSDSTYSAGRSAPVASRLNP